MLIFSDICIYRIIFVPLSRNETNTQPNFLPGADDAGSQSAEDRAGSWRRRCQGSRRSRCAESARGGRHQARLHRGHLDRLHRGRPRSRRRSGSRCSQTATACTPASPTRRSTVSPISSDSPSTTEKPKALV